MTILSVESVNKVFRKYENSESLKHTFTQLLKKEKDANSWDILKNISFSVKRGERIGIIGNNGAGKSTLLKIIAGIYAPTKGSVINYARRMLALVELGAGFYPNLTGRENIKLNWLFNGLPKSELKNKYESIVEFSGLEKFIDTPLKYYSSGMLSRLGFATAIHADPDLLILDEVLAVGDKEFQSKCISKINELCGSGAALLLVSHNMSDILNNCDRVIWLDKTMIANDGPAYETVKLYDETAGMLISA